MDSEMMAALARIEAKLDALLEALAEEDEGEQQPAMTLDGQPTGGERDQGQAL